MLPGSCLPHHTAGSLDLGWHREGQPRMRQGSYLQEAEESFSDLNTRETTLSRLHSGKSMPGSLAWSS